MAVVLWLHLIAAATWLGGLITMGAIVAALRKAGVDRSVLQAAARGFGRVSWAALATAVATGGLMALDFLGSKTLAVKMGLVAFAAGLAAYHQFAARNQSPRTRGLLQVAILVVGLGIFATAMAL
ncbi:MAG: hypothetical protein OEX04_10760 [Acidimicrobiia bacterium]|nr:hypothetical protein [Acidimicrobiia bacterium]MDH4307949.1 hypothetical protein [Acidimicrobiia bacterium]MDH5293725.1 hypothetical protein [Acidimicrobiia bacterium]